MRWLIRQNRYATIETKVAGKKVKRMCVNGVTTLMENLEVNKLKIFRGDKVMSFIFFLL